MHVYVLQSIYLIDNEFWDILLFQNGPVAS